MQPYLKPFCWVLCISFVLLYHHNSCSLVVQHGVLRRPRRRVDIITGHDRLPWVAEGGAQVRSLPLPDGPRQKGTELWLKNFLVWWKTSQNSRFPFRVLSNPSFARASSTLTATPGARKINHKFHATFCSRLIRSTFFRWEDHIYEHMEGKKIGLFYTVFWTLLWNSSISI